MEGQSVDGAGKFADVADVSGTGRTLKPGPQPPPCWTPYAPASTGLGHRGSDVLHQIGFLPGETAVLVWCSAEMAVSGGAAIDRPVELERAADVDRREPEDFG